jgi:hypothetical protein
MAEAEKNENVTLTKADLKKLLDDTAASTARQVTSELLANMVSKSDNPAAGGMKELAEQLALAIAEVSDQGTNRKRVAPEILAGRAKAYDKMIHLLTEARDRGDAARREGNDIEAARWFPEYIVVAKTYLTDRVIEPWRRIDKDVVPTEIVWRGIPNNALRPHNAIAHKLFEAFQGWVGTEGLLRAESSFVTPGGVVIKGEAPAGSRLNIADEQRPADLEVIGSNDPTAPYIRVLGTIADPARQNVAPKRSLRDNIRTPTPSPTGQNVAG